MGDAGMAVWTGAGGSDAAVEGAAVTGSSVTTLRALGGAETHLVSGPAKEGYGLFRKGDDLGSAVKSGRKVLLANAGAPAGRGSEPG